MSETLEAITIPVEEDERDGKPSASSMNRTAFCPMWPRISKGCRSISTAASRSGDRVHRATHLNDPTGLADDELEAYRRNQSMIGEIRAAHPLGAEEYREERIWLYEGLDKIASGRLDIFWIYEEFGQRVAVALDWKTGWRDAEDFDPQTDLQLRTQAVLLYQKYGVTRVKIGFYLPRYNQDIWVTYEEADLAKAFVEIVCYCAATRDPSPITRPGPHCRYCPGMIRCSSYEAVTIQKPPPVDLKMMGADELKDHFHRAMAWKQFADLVDAIIEEVRSRLKDGEKLPWAVLENGTPRREIGDALEAYFKLKNLIPFEEFAEACSVKVGVLERIVWTALNKTEKTTQEKAKKWMNKTLGDQLTYKKPEPSVKLVMEEA